MVVMLFYFSFNVVLSSDLLYKFWIGDSAVSFSVLSFCMAIYVLCQTGGNMYMFSY